MRSLADALFRPACVAVLAVAALHGVVRAQGVGVEREYARALERETAVRERLEQTPASAPKVELLNAARAMVSAYESIANRFPRSGYSDNALWQAALLAADAFWRFGDGGDRITALRLFDALQARYPASSLLTGVAPQVARLKQPAPTAMPAAPVPARASSPAAAPGGNARATLTAIRREVLPEALRVTLELGQEAQFAEGSLDGPPRVFVDLANTAAVEALKGTTLTFPDDVVRQIRLGQHEKSRTRVVMDLTGRHRHSVYALYNPYRVVIDLERTAPASPQPAARVITPPPSLRPAEAAIAASIPTPPLPIITTPPPSPRPSGAGEPVAVPAAAAAVVPESTPPDVAPVPPSANRLGGYSLSRQLGLGIARIVVDPGHGGRDPGAQVSGLSEADLVLDVALRFEKLMLEEPGVEVVLTRRTDVYVPLEERTAIANRTKADLFLSIHANASANAKAVGVETYVLNFASNPEAEAIAARENAGSTRTMRELSDIVRAIATNNKIDESRDFASSVQRAMFAGLRRTNRDARNLGVKQAPFTVLVGAGMPGLLTEIGFLTHRQEGALLKTERYRQLVAESLATGVLAYQRSLKSSKTIAAN